MSVSFQVTSDAALFDEDSTMLDSSMSTSSNSMDTIVEDWEEVKKASVLGVHP